MVEPNAIVHSILEGETPTTMAKSTELGIVELATHLEASQNCTSCSGQI